MKILFVGHHLPGYTHTNVYRERAIRSLGHSLILFDDRAFLVPGRVAGVLPVLRRWDVARLNRKLIRTVSVDEPDLCIVMGTRLMLLTGRTVQKIKALGSKIVLWVTDLPQYLSFDTIKGTAHRYDHVFCAGTEHIELLQHAGITNLSWLSFGCDPELHTPVDLTQEDEKRYGKDVAFVGACYPNRRQLLQQLTNCDLGIWGPGWDGMPTGSVTSGRVDRPEWIRIYTASKIVLVIHFQDGITPCFQASPKIYEALACGSFVLTDRQADVFRSFQEGVHLAVYNDAVDLAEKVAHYLERPEERNKMAQAGRELVLNNHTYRHRIETIITTVFG